MMNPGAAFEFGPFSLEPGERRLAQGAQAVALTPKAFDLLVILVENAGRLLKKEDLIERLWPGVFVEEVNLAQNISALRRALGGGGRDAYIQTVAGAGYRFVATVRQLARPPAQPAAAFRERLIVLPFRMLKPDPELDFLAFSLPDALTAELSAIDSIVVRSSLVAARFAGDTPDLARIARDAHVDFVVSGTLLRAGDQLRVSAQLSDAAAGTLLWSHTAQAAVDDLFQLQDRLVERIAGSLAQPLTASEQRRLRRDVPATPLAYELFLRGNAEANEANAFRIDRAIAARDLYVRSIEQDPAYAPAWARLARMYRLLGKYAADEADANAGRADEALQRALALNPDLSMAHNLFAQVDVDRGRAADAMQRLFERLQQRGPNAELYAGLVQACRFCGLLDASVAAHRKAQQLDPSIATSVMHTFFVMRRYDDVIDASGDVKGYVYLLSLSNLGRIDEARALAAERARTGRLPDMLAAAGALIEGDAAASYAAMTRAAASFADPEAWYYAARHFALLGLADESLAALERSVSGGYSCVAPLLEDPAFECLRSHPDFARLRDQTRTRHEAALAVFRDAGGAQQLEMGD